MHDTKNKMAAYTYFSGIVLKRLFLLPQIAPRSQHCLYLSHTIQVIILHQHSTPNNLFQFDASVKNPPRCSHYILNTNIHTYVHNTKEMCGEWLFLKGRIKSLFYFVLENKNKGNKETCSSNFQGKKMDYSTSKHSCSLHKGKTEV